MRRATSFFRGTAAAEPRSSAGRPAPATFRWHYCWKNPFTTKTASPPRALKLAVLGEASRAGRRTKMRGQVLHDLLCGNWQPAARPKRSNGAPWFATQPVRLPNQCGFLASGYQEKVKNRHVSLMSFPPLPSSEGRRVPAGRYRAGDAPLLGRQGARAKRRRGQTRRVVTDGVRLTGSCCAVRRATGTHNRPHRRTESGGGRGLSPLHQAAFSARWCLVRTA